MEAFADIKTKQFTVGSTILKQFIGGAFDRCNYLSTLNPSEES